jgi:transcriptional regulator with XRE-family HTH domain
MATARKPGGERRHEPVFPGFKEMAERRRALADTLAARRAAIGLSQTEVAARMGTSQSAVARLESGDADVRLSTLERYVAALGERLDWGFERPAARATTTGRNPKGQT